MSKKITYNMNNKGPYKLVYSQIRYNCENQYGRQEYDPWILENYESKDPDDIPDRTEILERMNEFVWHARSQFREHRQAGPVLFEIVEESFDKNHKSIGKNMLVSCILRKGDLEWEYERENWSI